MPDKLKDTLAALERGEKPPCPRCGAEYDIEATSGSECHVWQCNTTADLYRWPDLDRGEYCYERELADLRVYCAAQDSVVRDLKAERDAQRQTIAAMGASFRDRLDAETAALRAEHDRLIVALRGARVVLEYECGFPGDARIFKIIDFALSDSEGRTEP